MACEFCQSLERAQRGIEGGGDRGGQKAAGSARCQEPAYGVERLRSRFHDVVAFGPVEVHIEESGGQGCAGEVQRASLDGQFAAGAGGNGGNSAVFDLDEGVFQQPKAIPEPLCSEHSTHREDYCRVGAASRGHGEEIRLEGAELRNGRAAPKAGISRWRYGAGCALVKWSTQLTSWVLGSARTSNAALTPARERCRTGSSFCARKRNPST